MQEGASRCTQLVVEAKRFGHLTLLGSCAGKPISAWSPNELVRGRVVNASGGLVISPQGAFSFDKRSGRPLTPTTCLIGCELVVSDGRESANLRIEPEGYIHALP
ncbi:hypothetical protein D3C79_497490 [compost metagenome]